jgi:hypothetical protein
MTYGSGFGSGRSKKYGSYWSGFGSGSLLEIMWIVIRTQLSNVMRMRIQLSKPTFQCCGSITFWCGSGSGFTDPHLWLMDPDPGPGSWYFRHWPQDANRKLIFIFYLSTSKIKSQKESQNSRNQGFSNYVCMIEWSGSRAGSGSIPLVDPDPDTGSTKTCESVGSGSRFGSGSATLLQRLRTWKSFLQFCFTPGPWTRLPTRRTEDQETGLPHQGKISTVQVFLSYKQIFGIEFLI